MRFDLETKCYRTLFLWANLPEDNKLATPLSDFNAKIKSWRCNSCT